MDKKINIVQLPELVIFKIFTYLPYDNVAKSRSICKTFNMAAMRVLNVAYLRVENYHSLCLKRIKCKLPRRESERRSHELARHADVLTAIETRLSLLSMTFKKYIDAHLCCFIPGKVLDELYSVIRTVDSSTCLPRTNEILQELRDISSMAMEHFDENIVPILKKNAEERPLLSMHHPFLNLNQITSPTAVSAYGGRYGGASTSDDKMNSLKETLLQKMVSSTETRVASSLRKKFVDVKTCMKQQSKVIKQQDRKLRAQDNRITEMSKKLQENEQKLSDLTARVACLDQSQHSITIHKKRKSEQSPECSADNKRRDQSPLNKLQIHTETAYKLRTRHIKNSHTQ